MKKKILFVLAAIAFLIPAVAAATPVSWDKTAGLLQPLLSSWTDEVRIPYLTATSTTATSTFNYGVNIKNGCLAYNGNCLVLNSTSFSTTSADYWKTQRDFFSTTSAAYFLSVNQGAAFSTTSATNFLTLNQGLAFSTTSAANFLSLNQSLAFSTTSAIFFVNASTTIPKMYSSNTFTNTNVFSSTVSITGNFIGALNVSPGTLTVTSNLAVGNPGYSFNGDTNTGFNEAGADTLVAITNGVERTRLTSTGLMGIGTSTPRAQLSVVGSTSGGNGVINLEQGTAFQRETLVMQRKSGTTGGGLSEIWDNSTVSGGSKWEFFATDAQNSEGSNKFIFLNSTTGFKPLLLSGNTVGIGGTTTPSSALSIEGAIFASSTASSGTSTFMGRGINLITSAGQVPCYAINGTCLGSGGSGTVTSVDASVPSFLSISGNPITTSGTLAISYSGSALPVANGGTGQTSFGQGWLNSNGSAITSSTSPTVNYLTATSTTATSTFGYGININGGCFAISGACLTGAQSNGVNGRVQIADGSGGFISYAGLTYDGATLDVTTGTGVRIRPTSGADTFLFFSNNGNGHAADVTTTFSADRSIAFPDGNGTLVLDSRTINTTSPLSGGGNLSSDRTISLGIVPISLGGTATSTAPAYGQTLVGNASGGFDYVATSTFGSTGGGGGGSPGGSGSELQYRSGASTFGAIIGSAYNAVLGAIGIGTTTPQWLLQLSSSTAPQLALTDPTPGAAHWIFRNILGNLFFATSSPSTFATSTKSIKFDQRGGCDGCTDLIIGGGINLRNARFISASTSALTAGLVQDVYTVPAGRRAFIRDSVFQNGTGGTVQFSANANFGSGQYFQITASTSVSLNYSQGSVAVGIVLEAGQVFAIRSNTTSGVTVAYTHIIEYDSDVPFFSKVVAPVLLNSATTTLYTAPANATSMVTSQLGLFTQSQFMCGNNSTTIAMANFGFLVNAGQTANGITDRYDPIGGCGSIPVGTQNFGLNNGFLTLNPGQSWQYSMRTVGSVPNSVLWMNIYEIKI